MGIIFVIFIATDMHKRHVLTLFYFFATIGAIPLVLQKASFMKDFQESLIPLGILFISFGIVGGFFTLWLTTFELFPISYMTTSLGFCNMTSRFFTILAPKFAEFHEPVPQNILFAICLIAIMMTFLIDEKTKSFY